MIELLRYDGEPVQRAPKKGPGARSAPMKKSGPRKGARKVEEGSGTQRNATEFDVGWWKSPSRQGLGGWVKLPVEDCSTNRQ